MMMAIPLKLNEGRIIVNGFISLRVGAGTDFNDYGVGENEAYTYATRITEDIYNLFISYRVTE